MSGIALQEVGGVGALIMLPANELDKVPISHPWRHFVNSVEEEDKGRGKGWREEGMNVRIKGGKEEKRKGEKEMEGEWERRRKSGEMKGVWKEGCRKTVGVKHGVGTEGENVYTSMEGICALA